MRLQIRLQWIMITGTLALAPMLGCGEDDSPAGPNGGTDDVLIPVSPDSSVEHEEFVATVPDGLFADSTDITVGTAEQPELNPPPEDVTQLSDVVTVSIPLEDLADLPDSIAFHSGLTVSLPGDSGSDTYVRVTVSVPGREPLLLFGRTVADSSDSGRRIFKLPVARLANAAEGDGNIEAEMQMASRVSPYRWNESQTLSSIPMQLYRASLTGTDEVDLERISSPVGNLGSKLPVLIVHGWSMGESNQGSYESQKEKLRDYWGGAVKFILTESGNEFEVFCLYYDEDNLVADTAEELEDLISSRFGSSQYGRVLVLAHSMGGLLTRAWVTHQDGDQFLRGAVFIDTPHHGSCLGDYARRFREDLLPFNWSDTGAENLTYQLPLPTGLGYGNPALDRLNEEDHNWRKYVNLGGSLPAIFRFYWYTDTFFTFMHASPVSHDGIVELNSQIPEDLPEPRAALRHNWEHNLAHRAIGVLEDALTNLRDFADSPSPAFIGNIELSAEEIDLGDSFTLTISVKNTGATSDDGAISVSFPDLTSASDAQRISSSSSGDDPGHRAFAAGESIHSADCQLMTAGYLLAEYGDANWSEGETNTYTLTVHPRWAGEFDVLIRTAMHDPEGGACSYIGAVPSGGTSTRDQQGWAVRRVAVTVNPGEMTLIPAGDFIMGDGVAYCGQDEHHVTLTRDFYLGKYEVTNGEYVAMLQWAYDQSPPLVGVSSSGVTDAASGKELVDLDDEHCEITFSVGTGSFSLREVSYALRNAYPSGYDPTDHPVKEVTWYGAVCYCDWLSQTQGYPPAYNHTTWECNGGDPYGADGYRLPTDAEWEYATQYYGPRTWPWGDQAPSCGRVNGYVDGNSCVRWTTPVGSYPAAPLGLELYDMAGNVWEWCNDWRECDLGTASRTDPVGPSGGSYRLIRGGAWSPNTHNLRCAHRHNYNPYHSDLNLGFRVSRTSTP